ncbi:acylphosphatase [Deinococcus aquiradiocola]|uniref:acylphosphatase n=1 Tax=Deinococcus aquiradiocola TaxID=393059 RepID=A0A917PKS5_9DEIO|nr:acylphosphatase [Deinococcus aquiradiocola]GGJ82493.1 acylphosphatase [Deinococcus aquiradiocola]
MRIVALVAGRVTGVGYRRFVQGKARDLGLAGSAENLTDGRVEVVAEGERPELERLLHWLHRGPAHARVTQVDVQWTEATGLSEFHIF